MQYPLFEKIKERLEEQNQTQDWLAVELGKSKRTVYNYKIISELSLEEILKLTAVLKFDFLDDYNTWLAGHNQSKISVVKEVEVEYKIEPKVTMQISLLAKAADGTAILEAICSMGQRMGFEVK